MDDTSIRRRLAAILAADIAGYSRLMHEDEPATVRALKNIAQPIRVARPGPTRSSACGMSWPFPRPTADRTEAPRLSIVVLPFTNLSGDPTQEYFADGITEDLTSDLSQIAGSFVISRNTAFTLKGKAVDARQIGRELGVRYVLEGSVRRMGGTVRVNAQLIDAGSGAHLWAEQMDVDQGTLATLQDNFGIANRLARTLSVELVNVEGRRAPRTDPDAVDLAMRGWSVLNGGPNEEDARGSVELFEDALRLDPDNSQARVGLAQALTPLARRTTSLTSISPLRTLGGGRPQRRRLRSRSS